VTDRTTLSSFVQSVSHCVMCVASLQKRQKRHFLVTFIAYIQNPSTRSWLKQVSQVKLTSLH